MLNKIINKFYKQELVKNIIADLYELKKSSITDNVWFYLKIFDLFKRHLLLWKTVFVFKEWGKVFHTKVLTKIIHAFRKKFW